MHSHVGICLILAVASVTNRILGPVTTAPPAQRYSILILVTVSLVVFPSCGAAPHPNADLIASNNRVINHIADVLLGLKLAVPNLTNRAGETTVAIRIRSSLQHLT